MNSGKKPGFGKKLETALTWAAILYLLAWLFDSLIRTRWGAFLILTLLGTIGWAVPLCYVFYYTTDGGYGGTIMAISAPLGAITALWFMAKEGIIGKPTGRSRKEKYDD
jgi:hypothetical protein